MRADRTELYAASGVPFVFDRFGMIGPLVAEVIDPLSTARGISTGLALGTFLWTVIVALTI